MRQRDSFDFGWRFHLGDLTGAEQDEFDDADWRRLDLPHDWSIEGPFDPKNPSGGSGGFSPGGLGWYRKRFEAPADLCDRKLLIEFDGIYHNSDVWINGHHLGKRPYGYVGFEYDLTPHIHPGGRNVVAVRVDNSEQPNCRWYTGSGIYRHVWLTLTDACRVSHWGTCVTTPKVSHWGTCVTTPKVSHSATVVRVRTNVANDRLTAQTCTITSAILGPDHGRVAESSSTASISAGETSSLSQDLDVPTPCLWSPDTPSLYALETTVSVRGRVVDSYVTAFGIRTARFDADRGFLLNGEPLKLKGVNLHHDGGCLGAAVPELVWQRRLETLKSLGCNAIRTSHNPPAPELLDLCDRMGLLVVDEAFDKWHSGWYGHHFEAWWQSDLQAMLQRDRNHPCVVIWSVGNEVEHQGSPEMVSTLKMLADFVHREEPTRPVTCALHPNMGSDPSKRVAAVAEMAAVTEVLSCNYQEPWYEAYREASPGLIVIGSETFPYFRPGREIVKAYDPVNPWFDVVKHDWVAGHFVWAGIDYLGESPRWPSRGWAACPIATTGVPKPSAYFQQSVWSDKPMVHIAVFDDTMRANLQKPHWNWPKLTSHWTFPQFRDEVARLVTFTNCEAVELFIGGRSCGIKRLADFPDHMMIWYVPYEPGVIRAVGRLGGEIVAEHELRTAGPPAAVRLTADRTHLCAKRRDVAHLTAEIVDAAGVVVPQAEHLVTFELSGDGRILGVDNGDLDSPEPYTSNRRRAFGGQCLAIVQSDGQAGSIEVTAMAPGLRADRVTLANA